MKAAWAWIQHDDSWGVDWRPEGYWPANTKVHVAANLYELKLADGMYGAQDLTSYFAIGRAQMVERGMPTATTSWSSKAALPRTIRRRAPARWRRIQPGSAMATW